MEEALANMITDEKLTMEVLDKVEEHHHRLLDTVLDYDYEAVYFGDDWGQQKGLIIGPNLWRKLIKSGVDVYNTVQPEIPVEYCVSKYRGDKDTFTVDLYV